MANKQCKGLAWPSRETLHAWMERSVPQTSASGRFFFQMKANQQPSVEQKHAATGALIWKLIPGYVPKKGRRVGGAFANFPMLWRQKNLQATERPLTNPPLSRIGMYMGRMSSLHGKNPTENSLHQPGRPEGTSKN